MIESAQEPRTLGHAMTEEAIEVRLHTGALGRLLGVDRTAYSIPNCPACVEVFNATVARTTYDERSIAAIEEIERTHDRAVKP